MAITLAACGADAPEESVATAPDPEGIRLNNRGVFLMNNGQPRQAVEVLLQAAERTPERGNVHFNLGLGYYRLGEVEAAISYFQKAVNIDSLNGSWRFALGNALSDKNRYPEAATQYRHAVGLAPENAAYQYQLGKALRATSDFDEAIAAFDAALIAAPDYVDALYHRSELLARSNRPAEAEAGFLALLERAPQHVAGLVDLAALQAKENRSEEAVRSLERVIAVDPRHVQAHYLLYQAFNRSGKSAAANQALKTYQRLTTAKRHYDQGQVYLLHGDRVQATTSFSQSIEADSSYIDAYLSLSLIYLQSQRSPLVLPLLEKVLRIEPDHSEALSLLGDVYLIKRNFDKAEETFERAVSLDSTSVRAIFGLGRALLLNRKYEPAVAALSRTIEWAPAHLPIYIEAHYVLALAQIQLNKIEEARRLLKKVLTLNPQFTKAATKLAQLEGSVSAP